MTHASHLDIFWISERACLNTRGELGKMHTHPCDRSLEQRLDPATVQAKEPPLLYEHVILQNSDGTPIRKKSHGKYWGTANNGTFSGFFGRQYHRNRKVLCENPCATSIHCALFPLLAIIREGKIRNSI